MITFISPGAKRLHSLGVAACAFALTVFSQPSPAPSPVTGANVNMVSGTTWPGGDPFLQRQNEPSVAVSSRNPQHLMAGANDYRTVDLSVAIASANPDAKVTGDGWLGLFKSSDGGQTWHSTVLPGCPYNIPDCLGSAVTGQYQAGSDPVVRAGTNGMFYYSGLAFNRDHQRSAVVVSRFIDDNNREAPDADTIRFLDSSVPDQGNSGTFVDKPWLAVDLPRAGSGFCTIPASQNAPAQNFPAGNVYVTYTKFTGQNNSSTILVARSTDCGHTWSPGVKISAGSAKAQGSTIAIDPSSGAVYAAWRRFQLDTTQPDSILIAKSTDGGRSFGKGVVVSNILPFDQNDSQSSFRTLSFPSLTVDSSGRIYAAWAARQVAGGDSRIFLATSIDGTTWSVPQIVDTPQPLYDASGAAPILLNPGRGHQIMPAVSAVGGKLMVVYYSLEEDSTAGEMDCPPGTACDSSAQFAEFRKPAGTLLPAPPGPDQLNTVFAPLIADATPAGGTALKSRHTIDVRAAVASIGAAPVFVSARVSEYPFGSPSTGGVSEKKIQQLRFNTPDLPLFVAGTTPFMGDYIDLNAQTFVPGPTAGSWVYNSSTSSEPVFHAVWTDNRDVRPPADGDWTHYTPLITPTVGPAGPSCIVGQAGMRNQNIYTAEISQGLLVTAPGNSKQLSTALQRAFSVVVQNATSLARSYRLTITNQPVGGHASFLQTSQLAVLDATAAPRSSLGRSVFVTSTNPRAQVLINVTEITAPGGTVVSGGLQSAVLLNPDLTNPDLTNPDLTNPSVQVAELYVPDLTNPDLTNPDLTNPDLTNPDLTNPDLTNPDLTNPDLTNLGIPNPDLTNPDLTNPDLTNPDLTNADISNGSLTDVTWQISNKGNTTSTFAIRLVSPFGPKSVPPIFKTQLILHSTYTTPAASKTSCEVIKLGQNIVAANINNPAFLSPASPDLTNPDLTNPDLTNASITLGPGETAEVTLRIQAPTKAQAVNFATSIQPAPVAQAISTNSTAITPTAALIVTTLSAPQAQVGALYNLQLASVGGAPGSALTWSLAAGSLPPGLNLSPAGVISGTPTTLGSFTFTVNVADSEVPPEQDTQDLTILVTNQPPLAVNQTAAPNGAVGQPYSFTPITTGGTAPLTWTFFGSLPPGLLPNAATGAISGTPTAAGSFAGYYVIQDSSLPQQSALLPVSIQITTAFFGFTGSLPSGTAGQNLAPFTIHVQDNTASPLPNVLVTISLDPNPFGGVLSGTATGLTNAGGNVSFATLQISSGGSGYVLRATAAGEPAAVSNPLQVAGTASGAALGSGRYSHTATTLVNGDVLLTGGFSSVGVATNTAELQRSSATGSTGLPTGTMGTARGHHTATLLADGRVLIVGGENSGATALATAEIYDPATGLFTPTGSMGIARKFHSATLLPDGTVLIAGGINDSLVSEASAELYNPATGTFSPTLGTMSVARDSQVATLLGTGQVLITGGGDFVFFAELYDPPSQTFSIAGAQVNPRHFHTATLLADGRVLLAGGDSAGTPAVNTAEIYDPGTGLFTATAGNMNVGRDTHSAILLPSGQVLIASGTTAELFDPVTGLFPANEVSNLQVPRDFLSLSVLGPSKILAAGGLNGAVVDATTEIYYSTNPPF